MQPGGIFTPQGRIKSNKTRNINLSRSGTQADVSRKKLNGNTVTKSVTTSRGYVPTAEKTKTVTDKSGNVVSKKTKSIDYNKADRKTNRVINNVGRNANDTYSYKKGGATKKALPKAQKGISTPKTYNQVLLEKFPKMAASDTLPENSVARTQFYAPSAYNASKAKVDRENEYNDSEGESRVRSKAELAAMKKKLSVYKQKGGAMKKMKTGGMVNSNATIQAIKVAGSKGVKSGVNPKASASNVAKGRTGGTSSAPKSAIPKAGYGMTMKKGGMKKS